jgi:CubicO group peptidase (beta-lactamase class C family)
MPSLDPAALDRAFAVAGRSVADGVVPWVVLGVAGRDGTVRLEAFAGPGAPDVTIDTVCLLASITKPIVATVVMQLVAEGRLVLTDPIERVLPEAARPDQPSITTWHLLSHTSGVVDLDMAGLLTRGAGHEEAVRLLLDEPRRSPPGSTFHYATSTFDLLAALISRLDGRPYPAAIRARVLEPLGMVRTTFDPRGEPADRVVLPLAPPLSGVDGTVPQSVADAFVAMAMPGAGLWSCAHDQLRFGRAMLRGGELDGVRVLPAAFVDLMTRETTVGGLAATGDPVTADHYALGWGKPGVGSPASSSAFGHGGISGTRLWIDPEHDLVVIYLTGAWERPEGPIEAVIAAVYAALV